jgi:hypothetical protein
MQITYNAPPTVARFMQSQAFFRIIAGPIGSGKTTGILWEIFIRALNQAPGPDNLRRTRWAIVRTTLSQLKMTILLDLLTWFRPFATYKVSEQLITLALNDVRAEIYLIPLEDPEDQKRLLSMQLTGAAINECIELDPDLVSAIAGRCGRFPSAADGGPTWFGLIADTNMPIEGGEWHKLMEIDRPPDWDVFIQPGGLEPLAENLANLPGHRAYYERLARGRNPDWIKRYVHAQYGEDPSGSAVHRESFRRSFHVVNQLEPVHGSLLMIGMDFGRNPAAIFGQVDARGRTLILDEVFAEDLGVEAFTVKMLRPRLFQERYMGRRYAVIGDPSGNQRDAREENIFDLLKRNGVPAYPAPTNNVERRLASVDKLLHEQRDGGPSLVIDNGRCPMLVRALGGAYRYAKDKSGQTKPLPEKKHPWSDVADGLQYLALAVTVGMNMYITRRIQLGEKVYKDKPKVSARAWT